MHAFQYDAPQISTVTPSHGPTTGDTSVVITGLNFDPNVDGDIVAIGGKTAPVLTVNSQGTQLTVAVPPGTGRAQPITVKADGQSSAPSTTAIFDYDPPLIMSVSSSATPPVGGALLTISGLDFGPTAGSNSVTIGGVVAPILTASGSSLAVTLPHGSGANVPLIVLTGGQTSNTFFFNYVPVVTQVSPNHGPEIGGTAITITGANFSPVAGSNSVTIDGAPAPVVSVSADGTQLIAVSPAGAGLGNIVEVTVDALSSTVSNASLFDYDLPS